MLRLLRNESVDDISREGSVPICKLEQWHARALAGMDAGLKAREDDPGLAQLGERQAALARPIRKPMVAECFNRTLKGPVFHGSVFKNLTAVRGAVAEFKARYSGHWRLGKVDFMSPLGVRQAYTRRLAD